MKPPASLLASVVVCTHNRASHLEACLVSLSSQTTPSAHFEVIVVDDGSTDTTETVCHRFASRPGWKIIRQPNAGLGAARQRGWQAASAPIIAYLDDDAIAPSGWLEQGIRRLTETRDLSDRPVVLGGPTRARWEAPRPAWLDDSLLPWLTVWSPYNDYRESSEEALFVGANMFFLRTALANAGGFHAALGRRGSSLLSHEESELWQRLRGRGGKSAYDPQLWVEHCVPSDRLRRAWFRRRIYWEGISMVRRERPAGDPRRLRFGLSAAWQAISGAGVLAHLLHPGRWGRSLHWQLHLAYKLGCAREWLRAAPTVAP